jgi:NAD(P)-dependent dehydrogenase (short-subunit alcohol dehydrogenase family)
MPTTNLFDLSGRVAVVTGGNGGIGRGIALGLAQAGAAVAVLARNEEKNQRVTSELQALGVAALAVRVDVSVRGELQPALEKVEEKLGPVSVLVNNAGIAVIAGVLDQNPEGLIGIRLLRRTSTPAFCFRSLRLNRWLSSAKEKSLISPACIPSLAPDLLLLIALRREL